MKLNNWLTPMIGFLTSSALCAFGVVALCPILAAWLLCGVINYGYLLAFYQREYVPYQFRLGCDRIFCFWQSLGGPIALILTIDRGEYRHGWMI